MWGKATPPPFPRIKVIFQKTIERDIDGRKQEIPAYAHENTVYVNFATLAACPTTTAPC
ncbi:MAG TPA: hypothetical protein VML19_15365 [Verrucomicrobiae bacterium]|nr:hypothetical protein [Verrucomicrobiae bacterium]